MYSDLSVLFLGIIDLDKQIDDKAKYRFRKSKIRYNQRIYNRISESKGIEACDVLGVLRLPTVSRRDRIRPKKPPVIKSNLGKFRVDERPTQAPSRDY